MATPPNARQPKSGVPAPVVAVVKAWARARHDDGLAVLRDGRRGLEPLHVPVLVDEVAEITAEQLLIALDLPQAPAAKDEQPVPFLGLELSQQQGQRTVAWLEEQAGLGEALGLDSEAWSKKLGAGFERTLATLQGKSSETARAVGQSMGGDPLKNAARGFDGAADPRSSDKAGLRGVLAARSFKKP